MKVYAYLVSEEDQKLGNYGYKSLKENKSKFLDISSDSFTGADWVGGLTQYVDFIVKDDKTYIFHSQYYLADDGSLVTVWVPSDRSCDKLEDKTKKDETPW